MSNHDGGAAFHDTFKSVLDQSLRVLIERTGSLVKEKDAGLANDGTSDSNALFLTTG